MKSLVLAFIFHAGIANACGPFPCAPMWDHLRHEAGAERYQFKLSEVLGGQANIETLVRSDFPEVKTPPKTGSNLYDRRVPIELRKAALKPVFDRLGIADAELPANSTRPGLFAPAFEPDLDYASALIKEGAPTAEAKRLVLLRERMRFLDSDSTEWPALLKEAEPFKDDQGFGAYLYAAAERHFHWLTRPAFDSDAARDSLQRFEALRSSKIAWVRDHATLTSISARIAPLAWSLEKDEKNFAKPADVQPILDEIASFEEKNPKSELLGAVQRFRVGAYAVMGDRKSCFEALAKLTESYFAAKDLEGLRQLHVDHSLSVCPAPEFTPRYPHLAALAALPADLGAALQKLEGEKSSYASSPQLFMYLKSRILFALGKHEELLALKPGPKTDTPLMVVTQAIRINSLLAMKRYPEARALVSELVAARKRPGALRLLAYRVRVEAGDFVGLANDPLLQESDVLVWVLYNEATDAQLADALSRYDRIPRRMRPGVFHAAVTRLLPFQNFHAFDGLKGREKLLTEEHQKVFRAIESLQTEASAPALLAAGDSLRRVNAGASFLRYKCFADSLGIKPQNKTETWTPYRYFKTALSVLTEKDRKAVEPQLLYDLVSCYRSSNDWYPCHPRDEQYKPLDPLPTRESWYHRLKSEYADTEAAKRLSSYW